MAKAFPLFAVEPGGRLADNTPLMLHTRLAEMYRFASCIDDVERVEELHNMRIAAKRLRYTMEIFASCFPGDNYASTYESVKSIQEQIGDIHDCDVRVPLLQSFLDAHGDRRPEIKIGIERAIRGEQIKRQRLYQKFRRYWAKLQQQSFKRNFLELLIEVTGTQQGAATRQTADDAPDTATSTSRRTGARRTSTVKSAA